MFITEISEDSWSGIFSIQEEAYTSVPPEELHVLKSKWIASPETCFTFQSENQEIQGYLLAHEWSSNEPPKLFEELPKDSFGTILFLHDLAVSNNARGVGVGKQLAMKLLNCAQTKQFEKVLLVAVQNSDGFWSSLGFSEIVNVPICKSYGCNAKLMYCDIQE